MTDAPDLDLELLPVDDEDLDPDAELDQAEESALEGVPPVEANEPAEPLGMTWKFDWQREQFVRQGIAPAEVRGSLALEEWINTTVRVARFAHAVFSDDYGMEDPENLIGTVPPIELLADFGRRLEEALLVHDRVTSVEEFEGDYDPSEGVVTISFTVETDDELRLEFQDVEIRTVNG